MLNAEQRREKEVRIYEAVLALLERGEDLSALTVSRIAAAAGIGKGTVYEYFPSKEEILRGLSLYCLDNEIALLDKALAGCHTLHAAEQALEAYVCELTRERIGRYHIVARAMGPSVRPQAVLDRAGALLGGLYARLKAAGELAPDVEEAYFIHVTAVAWLPCAVALTPCPELCLRPDAGAMLARTRRLMEKALR